MICYDGLDNDLDGLIDCFDYDCIGDPSCLITSFFIRGDIDENGGLSLADPVTLLNMLFGSGTVTTECEAACDVNGDQNLGLGDPIYLLSFLFANGSAPVDPFALCGPEELSGTTLQCHSFNACP